MGWVVSHLTTKAGKERREEKEKGLHYLVIVVVLPPTTTTWTDIPFDSDLFYCRWVWVLFSLLVPDLPDAY